MKRKSIIIVIILAILTICLIPVASSCTKASPYFPEMVTQLESPPHMVAANQLYNEYLTDEARAAAKYEGKIFWITDILIDAYEESESGDYLFMQGYQALQPMMPTVVLNPFYSSLSTIVLKPQTFGVFDFTNVATAYKAEVYGECSGILKESTSRETDDSRLFIPFVVKIKIDNIISITDGEALLQQGNMPGW